MLNFQTIRNISQPNIIKNQKHFMLFFEINSLKINDNLIQTFKNLLQ